MKWLVGYQNGTSTLRIPRVQRYENAAAKRKGNAEYVAGQPFALPAETGKSQTYPTYRSPFPSPFRSSHAALREPGFPAFQRETFPEERPMEAALFKLQTALRAYQAGSGKGTAVAAGLDTVIQSILTGAGAGEGAQLSKEVLLNYRRKRETEIRLHQEDLLKRFRLRHMAYIESDRLWSGLGAAQAGQIINMRI